MKVSFSFQVVSRGLAHILAYLERNEPEIIQPPPPLPKRTLQLQNQDHPEEISLSPPKEESEFQIQASFSTPSSKKFDCVDTSKDEVVMSEDDDPYDTGVVFEEDYTNHEVEQVTESDPYMKSTSHSRTSVPFSFTESRPSSAMAAVPSQTSKTPSSNEW